MARPLSNPLDPDVSWYTPIIENIESDRRVVGYDELDGILTKFGLRPDRWKRTYIVNKLGRRGWARYRGTRRPERGGGPCFMCLRPEADPIELCTWAKENGVFPDRIVPFDPVKAGQSVKTPAQLAADALSAYFIGWRDYCRAQCGAC